MALAALVLRGPLSPSESPMGNDWPFVAH